MSYRAHNTIAATDRQLSVTFSRLGAHDTTPAFYSRHGIDTDLTH